MDSRIGAQAGSQQAKPRNQARAKKNFCSDGPAEPLAGTAKVAPLFIALEHHLGWSHDILDGGVYGEELTAKLKTWLKNQGASLQLIRRPGRTATTEDTTLNLFIAHAGAAQPFMEHLQVTHARDLLQLQLELGTPTTGAREVHYPLLLVCTHGKRDVCCAVKGRPLAAAAAKVHPNLVWETSHLKGHRFAPATALLPWNIAYGRLSAPQMIEVLNDAVAGTWNPTGCRGRGVFAAAAQVAELAVRRDLGLWGFTDVADVAVSKIDNDHAVAAVKLRLPEGSQIEKTVRLQVVETDGVIASCGDEPKTQRAWVRVPELS